MHILMLCSVPTQVIVARSMTSKGVMSIATKVAIQLCCKIGGSPWTVEIPLNVSLHPSFSTSYSIFHL